MKEITVKNNQSIYDIALLYYGSLEGVQALIDDNPGLSLDSELTIGAKLKIDPAKVIRPDLVRYYENEGIELGTK